MGGLPAGRVQPTDHELETYAKRAQAVMALLRDPRRSMARLDEMRRNTEDLEDRYLDISYDDRVVHSTAQILIQRGILSIDELGQKMSELPEERA
jgi:Nitrile hydratase beta subunit